MKKRLRHKYGAKRTKRHGKNFPSKLEADVASILEQMKASGQILFYLWQVPIHIEGFHPHRVDFLVFTEEDAIWIEAKGRDLATGKAMRKLSEAAINCEIHVVHKAEETYAVIERGGATS